MKFEEFFSYRPFISNASMSSQQISLSSECSELITNNMATDNSLNWMKIIRFNVLQHFTSELFIFSSRFLGAFVFRFYRTRWWRWRYISIIQNSWKWMSECWSWIMSMAYHSAYWSFAPCNLEDLKWAEESTSSSRVHWVILDSSTFHSFVSLKFYFKNDD